MKSIIILLIVLVSARVSAQSIGVNMDGSQPDNSAILDIKSTSKGLLAPRLTTFQRTSIPGPAMGLTVFDLDTYSYWMYRGDVNGGWAELQHNFQTMWTKSGNNIYNANQGNVTIGPYSNLDAELKLNGMAPRLAFLNNGVQKGFIRPFGDDFKFGTYPGNSGRIVFSPKNVDKIWIDENGQMGIGTASPSSELTINGTNPYIEMMHNNVNTGFLMASGVNLKMGTNSTNMTGNLVFQTKLLDRMAIDENGQVGIGTNSPTSILSINSLNPIVQLKNNGVDKGFLQLVNDDIRIGTNLSNDNGKFIVRTNGIDRFTVDEDGNGFFGSENANGIIYTNGETLSGITFLAGNLAHGRLHASQSGLELVRNSPGLIRIRANSDGMYLYPTGQISIGGGGATAAGYVVSVEGKLIATELTALAVPNWPDYVFENDYNLRPLSEVKKFIEQNKHLPNIPAAAEVEKTGVQLGDMTKRLMEKVEELTLYVIQLQEQIDQLRKGTK